MPTPTNFEGINPRGTQDFIPCKDKAAVAWADAKKSVKKNLIPRPYSMSSKSASNIIMTADRDGIISTNNATASADVFFDIQSAMPNNFENGSYILSGCPQNENNKMEIQVRFRKTAGQSSADDLIIRDYGNGATFTLSDASEYPEVYIGCAIRNGYNPSNKKFEPMLRPASILDGTYAPSIPDNTELMTWEANRVLGVNNLMPFPYEIMDKSMNDVTGIADGDGVITLNGTSSDTFEMRLCNRERSLIYKELEIGKTYKASLGVDLGQNNLYLQLGTTKNNSYADVAHAETGTELVFTITNSMSDIAIDGKIPVAFYIRSIGSGNVFNNLKVYPQISLAEDISNGFQSPTKTNEELTNLRHYKKGDVCSISNANAFLFGCAGCITSAQKELRFIFPLDRPVEANNVTVNIACSLSIRGKSGYVINGNTFTDYNIVVNVTPSKNLIMQITKKDDTAFSEDNNTPLYAEFLNGSLTFTFS